MANMDLEIRHLKLVEAIAQEGTMTRAGERLHVSQSALSHQLSDLEHGLGVALFQRVPRGMRLTAPGERLLTSARAILREVEQAQDDISGNRAEPQGPIRISTACYTCYHWLPGMLKAMQRSFPGIEIRIVVEATRRPVEALLAGEIDVAIAMGQPQRSGVVVRDLFEDELVAIMSPDHRLATRPYVRAADFEGESVITYCLPIDHLTLYKEVLEPAGVTPGRLTQVELTEAVIEMVKANLGIAALARWAVAPHLGPSLRAVKLTRSGFKRKWSAVTLAKRKPAYLEEFVSLLAGISGRPFR